MAVASLPRSAADPGCALRLHSRILQIPSVNEVECEALPLFLCKISFPLSLRLLGISGPNSSAFLRLVFFFFFVPWY